MFCLNVLCNLLNKRVDVVAIFCFILSYIKLFTNTQYMGKFRNFFRFFSGFSLYFGLFLKQQILIIEGVTFPLTFIILCFFSKGICFSFLFFDF